MFENTCSFFMATTMLMGLYGTDAKENNDTKASNENE